MRLLRTARALARLLAATGHALHGLALVLLRWNALDEAERHRRIAWWSRTMLQRLGIGLQVEGSFREGGTLIVANHISWLDIMAIHAVCPRARFVSKADVQGWPLVGRLVDAAGTLYIVREQRRDALRVAHSMAQALSAGDTVAFFPEGTTGLGDVPLPFHASLLQAAIATGTPIQPVALRFSDTGHEISPAADFRGDITLAQSLWMLAKGEGLIARVKVLPAEGVRHADRRALAQHLRETLTQALADMSPGDAGARPPLGHEDPASVSRSAVQREAA